MRNAQILSLDSIPEPGNGQADLPPVAEEFHHDDLMEQTRSDVRRMRKLIDLQQEQQERRTRIFSIVLGALIVMFLVSLWVAYPTLRNQKQAVAEILGLKSAAGDLGGRMNSAEASLTKMKAGLPALVDQLQANMKSNVQSARDQATQMGQRIRADVNHSIQGIQSRLSGLESNQKETSQHVNQLQNQIAQLNQELVTVRQQASASADEIKQLKDAQETSSRDLSGLSERVVTSQAALTNLSNRVERKRTDFQVSSREKTSQIAPAISLTLKHIDVGKQEIDALLKLGNTGRDLPIRGQGVQKPVLFYLPDGHRPIELVLTHITKDGIFGYLMMPASQKTAE